MKTINKKRLWGGLAIAGCALLLASCNSFCSESDVANYMYGYDTVNTTFFNSIEDGEDFIRTTFKTLPKVDQNAVDTAKIVVVTNIEGTTNKTMDVDYSSSLVFGQYKNINYIKPVTIKLVEGGTEETNGVKNSISYKFGLNNITRTVFETVLKNGGAVPTDKYFEQLDLKTLDEMLKSAPSSGISTIETINADNLSFENIYGYKYSEYKSYLLDKNQPELVKKMKYGVEGDATAIGRNNALLARMGYLKFAKSTDAKDYYETLQTRGDELVSEGKLDIVDLPTKNYTDSYKTALNQKVLSLQTCISVDDGFYGNVNNDDLNGNVFIEGKGKDFYQGWGEAFSKHGFLEGLLVYPIATLLENLSHGLGMNGVGQILAVLIVTAIVRLLFMLVTMPATISQQKMQYLQPELAKIQAKYPNSKENQYEKQKLAQAQQALYKKNKVHPFLSMLIIPIQFPIFICVWNAMRGSASLSTDAFLGLKLSETIWNTLTNVSGWPALPGWWTALVLVILMSGSQIMAMFIPNILNKKRMKQVEKTGVNPAQDQNNKTMKITQWVMTGFIIFMGFTLPSAMGVYWLAGALFSIAQSVIMHFVFMKKYSKKNK